MTSTVPWFLARLAGAASGRGRQRSLWRSRYVGPRARHQRTRRGGLLGSLLVAAAAYLLVRRRAGGGRGLPVGVREAVPEI